MSLLGLIIALVLVGLALWAINAYIPMEATIKRILNIVVIVVVVIWLLYVFGLLGELRTIRVPRL
jgi:hypothetical protein